MLKLSKKADYALMAMTHLAARPDRPSVSAREIAERYSIPVELLAKVLQRLAQAGLVGSHHGIRGGYRLSRAAATISVVQVIEAIEGPLTLTSCSASDDQCDQYAKCNVRDPLWKVKDRVIAALATCTIAELANDAHLGGEPAPVVLRSARERSRPPSVEHVDDGVEVS